MARREGDTDPEPSVPSADAAPEAGHDVPVDVPHGETAAPEGEKIGEADVPAGAGESTAGPEMTAAASDDATDSADVPKVPFAKAAGSAAENPKNPPPAETPKQDDDTERRDQHARVADAQHKARFGMFDDGELRKMAATLREKIEKAKPDAPYRAELATNLAAVQNELRLRSEERRQGRRTREKGPAAGRTTGTETDQHTPPEVEAQKTGLEQFAEKLDDPAFLEQLRTGSAADVDGYETQLDDAYATVQADGWKENTQREYQRLKAKLADLRHERWQIPREAARQRREKLLREFPHGTRVAVRTPQGLEDDWIVSDVTDDGRIAVVKLGLEGQEEGNETVSAEDLRTWRAEAAAQTEAEKRQTAQRHRELTPRLDEAVNDAREAYTRALRTKVHAFIGVKKDEQLNALQEQYQTAVNKRLEHTLDMLRRTFAGRDLTNPDVQQAFSARFTKIVLASRLREETVFLRSLREADAGNKVRTVQRFLAKHAKARLWIGAGMTGVSLLAALAGRGEVSAITRLVKTGTLGMAGTATMTDAAWQLIESSHGAMKKRTQAEINAMNDPDEVLRLLVVHKWKNARYMTSEFGKRAEFHLPRFDRQAKLLFSRRPATYDTTGQMLEARYQELMRTRIQEELRTELQQAGGNLNEAVLNRAKQYATQERELQALTERAKKERRLAQGKIVGNVVATSAMGYLSASDTLHQAGKGIIGWLKEHLPGGHHPDVPDTSGAVPDVTATPDATRAGSALSDTARVAGHPETTASDVPGHAELHEGQDADATIRAKEGIEHALRRQLEHFDIAQQHGYTGPDDPHALHAWSAGEAHRIAMHNSITDPATGIEHPIIDAKTGTEQWVHTPGTHVTLNADGSVTVDKPGDLYTHAAYHPDAAHPAAHVPPADHAVPEPTIEASALPRDVTPQDLLHQAVQEQRAPSAPSVPPEGSVLIGPDTYVPDLHQAGTGVVDHVAGAQEHAQAGVHAPPPGTEHLGAGDHSAAAGADHAVPDAQHVETGIPTSPLELTDAARKAYEHMQHEIAELYKGSIGEGYGVTHAIDTIRVQDVVTERSIARILTEQHIAYPDQRQVEDLSRAYWKLLQRLPAHAVSARETIGHVLERIREAGVYAGR